MLIPFLSCLFVIPVLIWLMRAEDPPKGTWFRFLITLVAVWNIADSWQGQLSMAMGKGVFLLAGVVFLWMPYYGRRLSAAFAKYIYSIPQKRGAFRPDYQEARSAAEIGDIQRAFELIRDELEKEPRNFEGLMLLASGLQSQKEPEKAMMAMKKILDNPDATPEQKRLAEVVYTDCIALQHQLSILGRPPLDLPEK